VRGKIPKTKHEAPEKLQEASSKALHPSIIRSSRREEALNFLWRKSEPPYVGCYRMGPLAASFLFLASNFAMAAQEEKIPPLRPPKNELGLSFWQQYGWWVALGALIAVALIAFVVALLCRPRPQPVTPPQLAARRALEALRGRADDATLAVEVSHIFRVYLYFALNLPAEELTTAELGEVLRSPRLGDADLANAASGFLKRCDEKKFAPPTNEPPVRFVDAACHLIDRLETHRQRRIEEAERERSAVAPPVAA
jgi:Domain of unknown function (DUF4381)